MKTLVKILIIILTTLIVLLGGFTLWADLPGFPGKNNRK